MWQPIFLMAGALSLANCSAGEPTPPSSTGPRQAAQQPNVDPSRTDPHSDMKNESDYRSLRQRLREHGPLPVIVFLHIHSSEAPATERPTDFREALLAETQRRVIERLIKTTGTSRSALTIKTFSVTPALALRIDVKELDALLDDPEVSRIVEDTVAPAVVGGR